MSKLKNVFGNAKAYAVTAALTASTMVPAFAAGDFDTTSVEAKLVTAGTAVAAIGAAVALIWVVKKGWYMIVHGIKP